MVGLAVVVVAVVVVVVIESFAGTLIGRVVMRIEARLVDGASVVCPVGGREGVLVSLKGKLVVLKVVERSKCAVPLILSIVSWSWNSVQLLCGPLDQAPACRRLTSRHHHHRRLHRLD